MPNADAAAVAAVAQGQVHSVSNKTPKEVKSLDEESRRNIKVGTLPQQRRPEKIRLAQDPQRKEEGGVRVALRRGGGN